MDLWELVNEIGGAVEEIAISRTVLDHATEYFSSTDEDERKLLPYYADEIFRLLLATNMILFELGRRLDDICTTAEKELPKE